MKVYGHPMSTCTRKVLTTLAEKQHEFEMVVVDIMKGEHKQPAHIAHQPFGVIPVLEDHNFWLYESRAIIRYLDAKLPGTALTPKDIHAHALMEQWFSVEQSYFSPAAMKIIGQLLFGKLRGHAPDMAIVAAGRDGVSQCFDVIEKPLSSHPYLSGDSFSLADISWLPYIEYLVAAEAGDLITSRPAVNAWWQRISSRPSWKKVTAK